MVGEEATDGRTDLQTPEVQLTLEAKITSRLHRATMFSQRLRASPSPISVPQGLERPKHLIVRTSGPGTRNGIFQISLLLHLRELGSLQYYYRQSH